MTEGAKRRGPKRKTMAGNLRHIAMCLERMGLVRFAATIKVASKEVSELRWDNGVMRRKLGLKKRKQQP